MTKITMVGAAVSLAINSFLALNGRGSFAYTILPMAASLWVGLPLILVSSLIVAVAAKRGNHKVKDLGIVGLCISATILSTLISIPFGKLLLKRDLMAATTFCDNLVPEIDLVRKSTGAYPRDLAELTMNKKSPRLLACQSYYYSDGTYFVFNILDPSKVMEWVSLSSLDRKWSRWN